MTKELNLTVERITVTPDSRPCGAKTVSETRFLIEKNAKNQAYHFIAKCGLMQEFHDFCMAYRSADSFEECIKLLATI